MSLMYERKEGRKLKDVLDKQKLTGNKTPKFLETPNTVACGTRKSTRWVKYMLKEVYKVRFDFST